ncbi:PREDICTED: uncharacterized protein LOC106743262 [Dinoponera quadriceps]|uniref:Elongator complex protein 6 n=1 Tax=Dinoponera quadriceps TaxID=609295 RepID=A0A6P3X204_DINQU|nr:PREDICTED: uncharacterized protein LOC106743262 [Dinoponera quadriceps]XP_014472404.1 PREDICTED: uncharacterized protein LOC106743262 [Dinoponera quadriceps]XP_014472405.1 PREDICTED: uncharacterized protein LOC106743262 [Dinoponera quadriceps]XP_014472406.1 PREDICTED: uncharacterized protein LOC106743262 [Dinoponera quadriceps]XP_014472407.1 PREDICTED: uncharacterized protein LOC106743262 [Dinoponera quadriceps]XP_014472408.1 PREDICTED: uncharacterized protein LOC106743262 [Dinoponera quadr
MASSMEMVCKTLGIDRVNMDGKMVLFVEQHGSNANFLVNAVMSNALKKKNAVCLVLCHNTFGHYHNIGARFGYNLLSLKAKGQVTVVEPMKIVTGNVVGIRADSVDNESIIADIISREHMDVVHRLFIHIRKSYEEAAKFNASVVLVIDDISHLFDLGLGIRDVMYLIRYLRSFMVSHGTSKLYILTHTYQEDPKISDADTVANCLKHMAHLCVTTEPLTTGYSGDASGKLTISWRTDCIRLKYHWAEKVAYLFKLLDWQVKVYAPGEASVLS